MSYNPLNWLYITHSAFCFIKLVNIELVPLVLFTNEILLYFIARLFNGHPLEDIWATLNSQFLLVQGFVSTLMSLIRNTQDYIRIHTKCTFSYFLNCQSVFLSTNMILFYISQLPRICFLLSWHWHFIIFGVLNNSKISSWI